jgi:hypothetical protein
VAVEFKVGGIGAMKPSGADSMGGMKME